MNRREFMRSLGRKSILAVLLVISGALLVRKKNENSCKYDFACKNCKSLQACNFPEALELKSRKQIDNQNQNR